MKKNLKLEFNNEASSKHGFSPSFNIKTLRILAKLFVSFFRLNSNSTLSTEICQLIEPKTLVKFNGKNLYFRSGHGRLKWRAETLKTEEPLMIEWINTFNSLDVFLDIGANVGTYSIPAALLTKLVIAIELDPANVFCLNSNIHYNKLHDKVIIIPLAAGSSKEIIDIHYRDFSIGDALQSMRTTQVLPTVKPNPYIMRQMSIPIDDIFKEYNLPQPSKIKIDVDGNELHVFDGAWNIIKNSKEIYLEDNGLTDDIFIIKKLNTLGFNVIKEIPSVVGTVKFNKGRNVLLQRNLT